MLVVIGKIILSSFSGLTFHARQAYKRKQQNFHYFFQFCIKELIPAKQCYGRTEFKTILHARILQKVPSGTGSLELLRHSATMKYERAA